MGSSPISSTFVLAFGRPLARCACEIELQLEYICFGLWLFWVRVARSNSIGLWTPWPRAAGGKARERMLTNLAAMDGLVGGGRGLVIPDGNFSDTPRAGAGGGGRWGASA